MASPAAATEDRTSLSSQKVLVTGATGFVGSHLCRLLSKRGMRVVATSRTEPDADWCSAGVQWRQLDVRSAEQCAAVVHAEQPAAIFHLASAVSGARESDVVLPMLHANLLGTVHLLCALQQVGAGKFVQVGSQEVPVDPKAAPPSPYAAAKMGATAYCRLFATLYGVPVGVARVFMAYGPGAQDTNKLVPYVAQSLLRGKTVRLMSGERRIDWIHIEDVADGLLRLGECLEDAWEIARPALEVDLGTGKCHSVREVVECLVRLTGAGPEAVEFGARDDRPGEVEVTAQADESKRRLGWEPRITLQEGLAQTLQWFRQAERERSG